MMRTRACLAFAVAVVAAVSVPASVRAQPRPSAPVSARGADRDAAGTTRMLVVPFEVADASGRCGSVKLAAVLLSDALRRCSCLR